MHIQVIWDEKYGVYVLNRTTYKKNQQRANNFEEDALKLQKQQQINTVIGWDYALALYACVCVTFHLKIGMMIVARSYLTLC